MDARTRSGCKAAWLAGMRCPSGLCAWSLRPLRVVAVEPLTGGRDRQAFYSTCIQADAPTVLTSYASRWSLEERIRRSKSELGLQQPPG